jgi:hypothetical protein
MGASESQGTYAGKPLGSVSYMAAPNGRADRFCWRLPQSLHVPEDALTRVQGETWKRKRLEDISERHRARHGRWPTSSVDDLRAMP